MRTAQVDKRARKMTGMAAEMAAPAALRPGRGRRDLCLLGLDLWPAARGGGPAECTRHRRPAANMLHFADLWPFPTKAVHEALDAAKQDSSPSRSTRPPNWRR